MNGRGFEDRREEESPRQQRQRGLPTKLLFDGTEHAPILVDGSLARCSVQRSEARCPNRVLPRCPNYTGRLSSWGHRQVAHGRHGEPRLVSPLGASPHPHDDGLENIIGQQEGPQSC